MLKRTIATVAATGVLALVPTAAFAYGEKPGKLSTKSSTVISGAIINAQVFGSVGDLVAASLTVSGSTGGFAFSAGQGIAGTLTSDSYTIAAGETGATFDLTVPEGYVGEVGLTSYVNGVAVDSATVTVVADAAAADELSSTGFDNVGLVAGAGALLVAGAGAVALGARRRAGANA